jgi:hypothetical protein
MNCDCLLSDLANSIPIHGRDHDSPRVEELITRGPSTLSQHPARSLIWEATQAMTFQLRGADAAAYPQRAHTRIHNGHACIERVANGARHCPDTGRRIVIVPLRRQRARARCERYPASPVCARSETHAVCGQSASESCASVPF